MKRSLSIAATVLLLFAAAPSINAQEYTQTPVTVSTEKVKGPDGKIYLAHPVKEKQTLYSISKAYGVSVEEIYKANEAQDIEQNGLKKDSIILIPIKNGSAEPAATTQKAAPTAQTSQKVSNQETTHIVRWYEDINSIADKYGVKAADIIALNNLKDGKVKNRQKIRIPSKSYKAPVTKTEPEKETAAPESKTEQKKEAEIPESRSNKDEVQAIILLPFNSKGQYSDNNLDFYSGVLMAVNDLKAEGISTDLSVYDMTSSLPVTEEKVSSCDMVIGPVSETDLAKVLALGSETPVISPINQKAASLSKSYRNFVQAPSTYYAQYADIVNWVKEDKKSGDKVILLTEKGKTSSVASSISSILETKGLEYSSLPYSVVEGRNILASMTGRMSQGAENRVIIASENEAFVNDAIRNLNLALHEGYNITVYGPSKIRSFDKIEAEDLHSLNTHISSWHFVDYSDPKAEKFIKSYRALYNAEPTQYAYQGYDIARYFIGNCARYGNRWYEKLDNLDESHMLQNTFKFIRTDNGEGGYANQGVRRFIYRPDFSIKEAK